MANCPFCGNQVELNAERCLACGASNFTVPGPHRVRVRKKKRVNPTEQRPRPKLVIILIVVAVAALMAWVLLDLLTRKPVPQTNAAPTQPRSVQSASTKA